MVIKRTTLVSVVVAIVLVAIVGTVATAMYEGIQAGRKAHPAGASRQGPVAAFPAIAPADSISAPANLRGNASTSRSASDGSSIAYPYPGIGPFQPGPGPFGQGGVAADGLSSWGVAFKETTDANAQPDAALIKSAYQDAQKKAQNLASATGIQLGKLLAISDYGQNEPYFDKACIQPEVPNPGGAPGSVPGAGPNTTPKSQGGGGTSSSSGTSTNANTATGTAIAAPPVPVTPCVQKHYVVTWVLLRYQIG
jgi:hypothetical protein